MPKGRPVHSEIRQNMIEILYVMGNAYGYDLYKVYLKLFPRITMRSIYYNLKKGLALNEFAVDKVEQVKGDYSWGDSAQKIYYKIGPKAKPKLDKRIREFFKK